MDLICFIERPVIVLLPAGFSTTATPSVEMTILVRIRVKADLSAALRDDKYKRVLDAGVNRAPSKLT